VRASGVERTDAVAALATQLKQLLDDAAVAAQKTDRKGASPASGEAVLAASRALIAGIDEGLADSAPGTLSASALPPLTDRSITLEDFEFLTPIAEGGAGKVYLARLTRSGDVFAVKLMDKAALRNKNMLRRVLAERRIMAKASGLANARAVKLHYAFRTRSHLCLVMVSCYCSVKVRAFLGLLAPVFAMFRVVSCTV
jgi:hypothetical protein